MRVLLIHGLARTPLSVLGLARDLRRAGHRSEVIAYIGAFESYRNIVSRYAGAFRQLPARRSPMPPSGTPWEG